MPNRLAAEHGVNADRYAQLKRLAALHEAGDRRVQRDVDLTFSATTTELYGANGSPLFDEDVEDAFMSLHYSGTYHPVFNWLGWNPSTVVEKKRAFITYMDMAGTAADTPASSAVTDPCDDGEEVEFGTFLYTVSGFGRMRTKSPVRSADDFGLRQNEFTRTRRLNGMPIANEEEFDAMVAMAGLVADLHKYFIDGNHASSAGQPDGLKRLVKYGYTDANSVTVPQMDSHVIDWKGLPLNGATSDTSGTALTYNGVAVANGVYHFWSVFEETLIRIKRFLKLAPMVQSMVTPGQVVWMMPSEWIHGMLQIAACFTRCGGDFGKLTSEAASMFIMNAYDRVANNPLADAVVTVAGVEVWITGYDWALENANGTADMFLLVKPNAPINFLFGEYAPASYVREYPQRFIATDGDRFGMWRVWDNTCHRTVVNFRPRFECPAPWAQARFSNIPRDAFLPNKSIDPRSASFYGAHNQTGFTPPE